LRTVVDDPVSPVIMDFSEPPSDFTFGHIAGLIRRSKKALSHHLVCAS